jgi:hypothetical protein
MSTETNSTLPTVKQLFSDKLVEAGKHDDLNMILNQPPPKKWVKEHPMIKKKVRNAQGQSIEVPFEYLPIDKVEMMLIRIFKHVKIEITGQGTAFNGVWVTVRIHYFHPVMNCMSFHDGIGSVSLQTKKGTSPADLANINHGALAIAFPIAKTEAIKDASHHFGATFGANLNRSDTIAFSSNINVEDPELTLLKTLYNKVMDSVPESEREFVERTINNEDKKDYKKKIEWLKQFDV